MQLSDVLSSNHIKTDLKAGERDNSIHEIIETMAHNIPDIEAVYNAVLEREKIMTTGVGNEIAIPHCKYPAVKNFMVGLGISRNGIDFSAIDHKKVKLIFLLIGPEDDPQGHIKLLSKISRIMNNADFRSKLVELSSAEEIIRSIQEEENNYSGI